MWKGMKVIDADAHMHEPEYLWDRYVEPKFRDRVPKVSFMDGVFMVYEPDGKIIPKGDLQLRPPPSAWAVLEEKYGEAYRQWWSADIRLKDMDRYGWDIQVLLPTGNNGNFAYRVNAQGSIFYGLTGLHGAHVFVGLCLLATVVIRSFRGHFSPEQHRGVEVPGIYWHFVDVMWVVVYTTIYVI